MVDFHIWSVQMVWLLHEHMCLIFILSCVYWRIIVHQSTEFFYNLPTLSSPSWQIWLLVFSFKFRLFFYKCEVSKLLYLLLWKIMCLVSTKPRRTNKWMFGYCYLKHDSTTIGLQPLVFIFAFVFCDRICDQMCQDVVQAHLQASCASVGMETQKNGLRWMRLWGC